VIVFLNGELVPEEKALVSVFDRSFLYGDGLFEGMRVHCGQPFRWEPHLARLQRGAEFLRLRLPFAPERLREFAGQLIQENQMPESLLRLHLSRGVGRRGYSPRGADSPSLVMSLHPVPLNDPHKSPQWELMTSSFRLPAGEPLANFKTANKLAQILARAEAESRGGTEGLLCNTNGEVVEGASSNLFWIEQGTVCTPPLASGVLPGVTRSVVLELCDHLGLPTSEAGISPEALRKTAGVFVSLSSWGIVEAVALDGERLNRSPQVAILRGPHHRGVAAPDAGRRLGRRARGHHRTPARRGQDRASGAPRHADQSAQPGAVS
jgi:aminodeoxychorismate lyase